MYRNQFWHLLLNVGNEIGESGAFIINLKGSYLVVSLLLIVFVVGSYRYITGIRSFLHSFRLLPFFSAAQALNHSYCFVQMNASSI